MNHKLLSIIVTVYNNEKYIEKCLESIGEFDKNEEEVIIIDDGSEDNTEKIIEKLNKYHKYLYIKQNNSGVSRARNIGIEKARGKYIWFIDGDDFLEKDSLKKILQELELNSHIEILYFGINYYDKNYNFLGQDLPNNKNYYENGVLFNGPCNKIYNKIFFYEYNIRFCEKIYMGEDMNFNFKIFSKVEKIKVIREGLYNYYRSGFGVTDNLKKRKEVFYAFDDLIINLVKDKKNEKLKKILEKYYIENCIKNLYKVIILSDLDFFTKLKYMKEIDKKIDNREWYFNKKYNFIRIKLKYKYYKKLFKRFLG